jgi:hypothetical protein
VCGNNIYYDKGLVGIGTSSPQYNLDIQLTPVTATLNGAPLDSVISNPFVQSSATSPYSYYLYYSDASGGGFDASGSFSIGRETTVYYIVVGGGGSGVVANSSGGGAGGGGGVVYGSFTAAQNVTYTITVGGGGIYNDAGGVNGNTSNITATGGVSIQATGGKSADGAQDGGDSGTTTVANVPLPAQASGLGLGAAAGGTTGNGGNPGGGGSYSTTSGNGGVCFSTTTSSALNPIVFADGNTSDIYFGGGGGGVLAGATGGNGGGGLGGALNAGGGGGGYTSGTTPFGPFVYGTAGSNPSGTSGIGGLGGIGGGGGSGNIAGAGGNGVVMIYFASTQTALNVGGDVNIDQNLNLEGNAIISGNIYPGVTGTINIEGNVAINGNSGLTVPGSITVGQGMSVATSLSVGYALTLPTSAYYDSGNYTQLMTTTITVGNPGYEQEVTGLFSTPFPEDGSNVYTGIGPYIAVPSNGGGLYMNGAGGVSSTGQPLGLYYGTLTYFSSSRRYKTNIQNLSTASNYTLENFMKIEPVIYNCLYKGEPTGEISIGVIAEDVDDIGLKELVILRDGIIESFAYDRLGVFNTKIIQEQQHTIEEQQTTIDSLKSDIELLKQRMDAVESHITP